MKYKTQDEIYYKIKKNLFNKNFNDLEKIAYMIMVIANERSFSSVYHWNDKNGKAIIVDEIFKEEKQSDLDDKQLICITAARLLKNIASKFGINIYYLGSISEIISFGNFDGFLNYEHVIPLLKIANDKYVSVDLERNLDNIQTKKKWFNFGRKDNRDYLIELNENEIIEIMKKIGYIKNSNDFFDIYIQDILDKNKNLNLLSKLEVILKESKISKNASKLRSSVDIFRFYKKIIKEFYQEDEKMTNTIFSFGGKIENEISDKKYITGIYYKDSNNEKIWLWSSKSRKMTEIAKADFNDVVFNFRIRLYSGKDDIIAENIIKLNKSTTNKCKINIKNYLLN